MATQNLRNSALRRWIAACVVGEATGMTAAAFAARAPDTLGIAPGVAGGLLLVVAGGLIEGLALGILQALALRRFIPRARQLLWARLHRLVDRSLIGLRVRGVRSGKVFELPVMYSRDRGALIVCVAGSAGKRWWRNLRVPAPVDVLIAGRWTAATARLVLQGDPDWAGASSGYFRRWPMAQRLVSTSDPMVRLAFSPTG